ncbi:hypothetical protein [Emticicia sp. C21]|uniref:hypothetical protein n=1 Tax=Emticicia sp. C21 TaxID=2302915 RepID=UPI000E34F5C6|nr:hypothetical protein [Emticicia sp. C21]RFS17516.1 hypothetical protein D0T08_07000 [Emticicia sp. C21]
MKKLLLLLFFYSSISYAQTDFTRIYHPIINEAELAIVDTNYHEALAFYNEAFANVEKPFAKDYYNAAVCATIIGKMPIAFDFLEKIVAKGYLVENFRKDFFFKNVADTCKQWASFEKQAKLIKPQINIQLRDSLQKMYHSMVSSPITPLTPELRTFVKEHAKEQKWMPVDSLVFIESMPKNLKQQIDSLRKLNGIKGSGIIRNNMLIAHKMLEVHGFLDENILGLNSIFQNNPQAPPFQRNTSSASSYLYENTIISDILIASSFQQSVDKIDVSTIVKQAIREGKAHPAIIKSLIGYSTEEPCTMGRVLVIQVRLEDNINCPNNNWEDKKERFYWKKEKSATLTEIEINERRQNLGLERLDDAYRKAFFKSRPTPFLIYGGSYQAELAYIPNCELIDKMIKGAVVLR